MISFDGDMPQISGTWVNPKTGHRFTVRDCYFEDSDYKIYTTDGTTISYNMLENYVQDTGMMEDGTKVPPTLQHEVPLEVLNELDHGNHILPAVLENELLGIEEPFVPPTVSQNNSPKTLESEMINKVLVKLGNPKVDITLQFKKDKEFKNALDTLVNQLDIPKGDILDYIFNKYVVENEKSIKSELNKKLFKTR